MRLLLTLAGLGLPIADIASLIGVGGRIGVWPTLAAVILAAVAGSLVMRTQGLALFQQAHATLHAGRIPAREVFDGVCVLAGGALLMLPGFVSDALGVLLLIPPLRALLRRLLATSLLRAGRFHVSTVTAEPSRQPPASAPTIEGEYHPVTEDAPPSAAGPADVDGENRSLQTGRDSPWRR